MEKILVLSDTHSNLELLKIVLENETDHTAIFHLGDNYEDLDKCLEQIPHRNLIKVPGIFHKGYRDKSLPAIKIYNSQGWAILLVHDLSDALAKTHDVDIYLHGHTHRPDITGKFGKIFFNPGHLKQLKDRGSQASYGIIELNKKSVKFFVKDLNKNVIYYKLLEK